MPADRNVRIRADLVPLLEARSRRMGMSLNAYVSDVLRVHLHPGEWAQGIRPPGLTALADALVESEGKRGTWIVLYGGLPPRLTLVAGRVVGAGPTHLRIGLHGLEGQAVLVPRNELTAWWLVLDQDHPEPEIREALRESGASALYLRHLL